MRRLGTVLLAAGLSAVAVFAADGERAVERRLPAAGVGEVAIRNVAGSVEVKGWDRDEVEIRARLGRGAGELAVDRRGEVLRLAVESRDDEGEAHLVVRVPRRGALEIETVSAAVGVEGVAGDVRVSTATGAVRIAGDPGAVRAETVSGGVEIDVAGSTLAVATLSGDVRAAGVRGRLRASSVSGALVFEAADLARAAVGSTSGRVELAASLAAGAEVEVSSHNGTVELRLPASTSARFEVSSFSGRVRNELGPPARAGRSGAQKELVFTTGRGAGRVRVTTFSGDVALLER